MEAVVVGSLEIRESHSHLDPGMSCTHPEELRSQLSDLVAEDDGHSIHRGDAYLVFIRTGTTPLCS